MANKEHVGPPQLISNELRRVSESGFIVAGLQITTEPVLPSETTQGNVIGPPQTTPDDDTLRLGLRRPTESGFIVAGLQETTEHHFPSENGQGNAIVKVQNVSVCALEIGPNIPPQHVDRGTILKSRDEGDKSQVPPTPCTPKPKLPKKCIIV